MTALLEVSGVEVRFGGIVALDGVTFTIPKGEIVGLIGPNGAGKTTLFNCLSRLYTPNAGDVHVQRANPSSASRRTTSQPMGIGRTFQNLALFPTLSVLNNVMIGGHCQYGIQRFRRQRAAPALGMAARSANCVITFHGADRVHGTHRTSSTNRSAPSPSPSRNGSRWPVRNGQRA